MGLPATLRKVLPLVSLRSAAEVDHDICEELEFHLAMATADNQRQGMTAQEARQAAEARFGDFAASRRACQRIDLGAQMWLRRCQLMLLVVLAAAVVYQGLLLVRTRSDSRQRIDELTQTIEQLQASQLASETTHTTAEQEVEHSQEAFRRELRDERNAESLAHWSLEGDVLARPWSDWRALGFDSVGP